MLFTFSKNYFIGVYLQGPWSFFCFLLSFLVSCRFFWRPANIFIVLLGFLVSCPFLGALLVGFRKIGHKKAPPNSCNTIGGAAIKPTSRRYSGDLSFLFDFLCFL
jgi:urea transporter